MAQPIVAEPRPNIRGRSGGSGGWAGGLVLTGIRARRFPPGDRLLDPASTGFLTAAVPAAGVALDEQRLHHQPGSSYADLARKLLPDLVGNRPVQLLVLAHVVPDFHISDVAAIAASEAIGGTQASFGVCDQGSLAPFTALRLAQSFAGRQGYERVVLMVADQGVLPYDNAAVQRLDGEAAVAMVFEHRARSEPLAMAHRSTAVDASPTALGAALDEVLREVDRPGHRPAQVVAGVGVPAGWSPSGARTFTRTVPGYPCTGAWSALAALAELGLPSTLPVVLLDCDPNSGHVGGIRLDPLPAQR